MKSKREENRRILIIDDNRMIHEDFRKIFELSKSEISSLDDAEAVLLGRSSKSSLPEFELIFAAQGQDGANIVKQAKESGNPIAMAFVDMRMPPGWDGLETIENIWKHDDKVQVAICTAFSDHSNEEIITRFQHSDNLLYIKKPFDDIEVVQAACALVNKWNLSKRVDTNLEELNSALKTREEELHHIYEKQRETEAQFHQSQKMEAIGRLTGGVAHDFNNLLTVILGNIELLEDKEGLDQKSLGRLEAIKKSAQSAAKLTQQLLAFSRQQVVAPELINLNHVIENNLGRLIERIVGENLSLVKDLDPNLPPIKADSGQIEQVIMNLVVNARDALEKVGSKIEITTRIGKNAKGQDVAILTVRDDGEGMSQETQGKIFEPFFTTKEAGKGTGIGLSTAYGIVAKHHGNIWVESELNKGTKFSLSFPIEKGEPVSEPTKVHETAPTGGSESILLVEDEKELRHLAKEILSDAGYDVIEAENGLDAYVYCMSNNPSISLLLTDVIMPNMGGKELAERISTMIPGIPILFMSGYTGEIPLLAESDSSFLQKPFSPNQMLQKVRAALGPK